MCVVGCKCVILEVCFSGIENGKPKCIVNHDTVYDDDSLALGRHSSVKVEGFLFFSMHFIRIVEIA
jgi:hypothetical protein